MMTLNGSSDTKNDVEHACLCDVITRSVSDSKK